MLPLPSPRTLLGGLDPEGFLRSHWQRKPLLVRQAWPGFHSPLDAETLAGLALEPEVESRLIRRTGDLWQLEHGPIPEQAFLALPETDWTLLVQDVDKLLPDLRQVLEAFRFVPDWRLDDLMVSYAAPGGSVGAHVDQYDVFLLQAQGRRRWQIDQRPDACRRERDDSPLRLLERFEPSEEWILEPGDMLYLPPGVPHHGVAMNACMTWSIGFRAPTDRDLLGELLQMLLECGDPERFFTDPGRATASHPALLDANSLQQGRRLLRRRLEGLNDLLLDRAFARAVSRGKPGFEERAPEQPVGPESLRAHLNAGGTLSSHPALRVALLEDGDGGWCYIEGEEVRLDPEAFALLSRLTSQRVQSMATLRRWLDRPDCLGLLLDLINQGHWELVSDADA